MPTLQERLQLLCAGPADAAAAVLLMALPRVADDELSLVCQALAATGVPDAIVGAVSNAPRLHEAAQIEVAQALALSEPVFRAVIAAGCEPTTSLIALMARREQSDAIIFLARLVATVPWQDARRIAAEALLTRLAMLLGPAVSTAALSPHLARRIDEALAEAVDRYREHRCDAVLHAVALLARSPGRRLGAILDDPGHPAMFALRHAVGRANRPDLRRQLLRMLTAPVLAPIIQRNLHRSAGPQEFDELLAGAHLLRSPARKRAMRAVDRPLRCLPSMSDAVQFGPLGQANLPLFIEALGLPTSRRIEHLADLVAMDSTLGRLRAVMCLGRHESDDARAALRPLSLDRSPWVARLAAQAALAGDRRDERTINAAVSLLASPHPIVARRARWIVCRTSTRAFFAHWLRLTHAELLAAAMAAARHERNEFIRMLGAHLADGSRAARLAALTITSRLQLVSELEMEVVLLAGASDSHIASAAVAALGLHSSPRSSEAVRVALRHTDARVRANAVEALARHDEAGAVETMAALTEHRHNRLRANSVLALLRRQLPAGAQALRAMLGDRDPMHRISGIWVSSRCNAVFARGDLRAMAERDGRVEVRRRAAQALRRIDQTASLRTAAEIVHA